MDALGPMALRARPPAAEAPRPPAGVGAADYAAARASVMGHVVSQTVVAVVQAGVIDALAAGARSIAELATGCAVDADALRRMLVVVAGEQLVDVDPLADSVTLTPRGALFRTDTPGSLRHLCDLMDAEAFTCWSAAGHALRTGRSGFEALAGKPFFDWLAGQPIAAERFDRAQAGLVARRLLPLLELDWSAVGSVVDVGAGDGSLLRALLTRHPHLTGTALDRPDAAARAKQSLAAAGLTDRSSAVTGDFFTAVPPGADVYLLAQVLHDWPDGDAVAILRTVRAALGPRSRLLILEQVVPDGTAPHPARLLDLHMLVLLGGRERTLADWTGLLQAADLQLTEVRAGDRATVLEARLP